MKVVLALDISITRTGIAVARIGENLVNGPPLYQVSAYSPKTNPSDPMKRYEEMDCWLRCRLAAIRFDLCVIEGYSFGSISNGVGKYEIGGIFRLTIYKHGIPLIVVAPTTLKKWAGCSKGSGKGNMVLPAAVKQFGSIITGDDEADAAFLAEIGSYIVSGKDGGNKERREVIALLKPQIRDAK